MSQLYSCGSLHVKKVICVHMFFCTMVYVLTFWHFLFLNIFIPMHILSACDEDKKFFFNVFSHLFINDVHLFLFHLQVA